MLKFVSASCKVPLFHSQRVGNVAKGHSWELVFANLAILDKLKICITSITSIIVGSIYLIFGSIVLLLFDSIGFICIFLNFASSMLILISFVHFVATAARPAV